MDTVSAQIDTAVGLFHEALARLDTIHGVNTRTAEVLIAELGTAMTVFPTACHSADDPWHLAPILSERAGQVKPEPRGSGRTPSTGATPGEAYSRAPFPESRR